MAEPVLVQALIAKASVETRHVATFAPSAVWVESCASSQALLAGRLIHRPTHELGSVVAGDLARQPAPARYRIGRLSKLPDLSAYPLCAYFLSGYLQKGADSRKLPRGPNYPEIFRRYEAIFKDSMDVLGLTKETLKKNVLNSTLTQVIRKILKAASQFCGPWVLLNRSGFTEE